MSYTISAATTIGKQTYTITGAIHLVSGTKPPSSIAFPFLGNTDRKFLGPNQGASIQMSTKEQEVVSFGLITCASVCYVNGNSDIGYVFHANAGHITHSDFITAMKEIEAKPPYNQVYLAYAHRNDTDEGYQSTIKDLIGWGMPSDNILEIANLRLDNFGLNNLFQIGY